MLKSHAFIFSKYSSLHLFFKTEAFTGTHTNLWAVVSNNWLFSIIFPITGNISLRRYLYGHDFILQFFQGNKYASYFRGEKIYTTWEFSASNASGKSESKPFITMATFYSPIIKGFVCLNCCINKNRFPGRNTVQPAQTNSTHKLGKSDASQCSNTVNYLQTQCAFNCEENLQQTRMGSW